MPTQRSIAQELVDAPGPRAHLFTYTDLPDPHVASRRLAGPASPSSSSSSRQVGRVEAPPCGVVYPPSPELG